MQCSIVGCNVPVDTVCYWRLVIVRHIVFLISTGYEPVDFIIFASRFLSFVCTRGISQCPSVMVVS